MKRWRDAIAVYSDRRLLVILLMGFASGLPLLLTLSTLTFWLAKVGVDRAVDVRTTTLAQVQEDLGMKEGFDVAFEMSGQASALRDMIAWIQDLSGLTRGQAYMLCSLAADMHVTQTVNVAKGVHCMLPKAALPNA